MPVLILAGGFARRMGGGDKTLIRLGDRAVLAHALDRLRPHHRAIAISANGDPSRFASFRCPVLADPIAGRGPLGGILAGLDWAASLAAAVLLTVPGDSPFVPADLAARLAPAPAMAASDRRVHPPVGLWPVAARAGLRALLEGAASARGVPVRAWAGAIGARTVAFGTDDGDPFADIDTPDDLARARARVAAGAGPC